MGTLCSTLCTCFAYDARMAPLLLAASGGDAGPTAAADNVPGAAQHAEASGGLLVPLHLVNRQLAAAFETVDMCLRPEIDIVLRHEIQECAGSVRCCHAPQQLCML